jgi:hypothetical protein
MILVAVRKMWEVESTREEKKGSSRKANFVLDFAKTRVYLFL